VSLLEETIALLEEILYNSPRTDLRIAAIQNLARLGRHHPINLELLYDAASKDPDPNVCIAAVHALTDLALLSFPNTAMSDQPKVQMTFNAPVYGVAGNVEGDQIINAPNQNFDQLLADYKNFLTEIQQKYPTQTPESAVQPIIDAEFQEIQKTQPQRWQNFLSLKRLWNGGKKATLKIAEHFAEDSPWGKAALAFLEGVMEDSP
jgi:HEAT repeats